MATSQTFSRSGKLLSKFQQQDFFKNSRLCTNLDLLQVDLLASGASLFLATKQLTASDEGARGRLVSLEGFLFAFHAKNGEWRD